MGRVMLGLAAANLIGVPLATFLGQIWGWRAAFDVIAIGGALLALLLPFTIPVVAVHGKSSPLRELSALRSADVWLTLSTAAIGFAGIFAIYTYITPTLTELAGQPLQRVPLFLALWGLGTVVGNVLGSQLADRWQTGTILGFLIWNVIFLGTFSFVAGHAVASAGTLFLIGIGVALVPALQARLMDLAPDGQLLAGALNHSAFNISNALGAWTGGLAITAGWGWASTGSVGCVLASGGLIIFLAALLVDRRAKVQLRFSA